MYDRTQEIFKKAGLNASETIMFQELLRTQEPIPLKEVIAACKMTEFTGYRTARRLVERGLAEVEKKGNLKYARALPLEKLAHAVGKQQRQLRRLELNLIDLAKQYTRPGAQSESEAITVVQGKDNFLDVYDSLPERAHGELRAFGSLGSVWQVTEADYFSEYERQWVKRRIRRGIKAILIEEENSTFNVITKRARQEMRDVGLLRDTIEPSTWTALLDKEAYIFENQYPDPRVIAVKDFGLVKILGHYHRLLWQQAKAA